MVNENKLTGMKKRQQIASANKMIFVWVIIASVAISFAGVTVQFLLKQAILNQNVIGAKLETQDTLAKNLENVEKLKENVNALLADTKLASVKANPEDTTLKVVLDALPTTDDKSALGASLQQVILPKSGVTTSDITTILQNSEVAAAESEVDASGVQSSTFTFAASGDYNRIKSMLLDMERTIRPMDITTLSLQSSDGTIRATVGGVTFYDPEQTVQLGKKTIKP